MVCEVTYSYFSKAAKDASKVASECREYADELEKKVSKKISNIKLGQTGSTSQASYFISQKKQSLNNLATKYEAFSKKIEQASQYAEQTDKKVAAYIKTEGKSFRKAHGMSSGFFDGFIEVLTRFTNGVLDSTALGRWIKKGLVSFRDAIHRFKENFKYWFFCDGGKYWVKVGLAVAGLIFAVVALIAAWPVAAAAIAAGWTLSTVAAVATTIMAVIGVADAVVSLVENSMAVHAFKNDPGWAERYGSVTSLSDFLHKTNFKSKFWNKFSEAGAFFIDVTTVACAIITVADSIKNVATFFKNGYRKNANWKRHFDTKTTKYGKFSFERTWKSIKTNKEGIDYAFKNKDLIQKKGALKRTSEFFKNFSKFDKNLKTFKNANKAVKNFTKQLESPQSFVEKQVDAVKKKLHFNEAEDVYKKGKKIVDTDYTYTAKDYSQTSSNPTPAPATP